MRDWFARHRVLAGVVAMALVVAGAAVYVVVTVVGQRSAESTGASGSAGMTFVDVAGGQNLVTRLDGEGKKTPGDLKCLRVYRAAGTTVCLRMTLPGAYSAVVTDASGKELRTVALPGTPSRARVSASGRMVSWTVFVTGDSYLAPGGFSTRTGILDLRTGTLVESLEGFATTIEGKPDERTNENYWGVTFGADDNTFYATLGSGSTTWLVKGDFAARSMSTVRQSAECPSLAPDGDRVAYKKREGRLGTWQLYVLDLASGRETLLPGSDGVDDQAAWLDGATLAYAKAQQGGTPTIYSSAADGSGEPKQLVWGASSPSP